VLEESEQITSEVQTQQKTVTTKKQLTNAKQSSGHVSQL